MDEILRFAQYGSKSQKQERKIICDVTSSFFEETGVKTRTMIYSACLTSAEAK